MTHLDDGTLRRMVDEPLAVADSSRRHYDTCPRCRVRYERVAADAQYAERALAGEAMPAHSAAALQALHSRIAADGIRPAPRRRRVFQVMRRRLATPVTIAAATVALIGALVWTPAGSLAQDFVTIFQPANITAVEITSADLRNLQGLSKYGTVRIPTISPPQSATSASQASRLSGVDVLAPAAGTTGLPAERPSYQVIPGGTASFTFSAAKAASEATASGSLAPPMPAKIDGSTLQVTIRTAVLTQYSAGASSIPDLIIGEMPAPVVQSTGVSVKELEDYLLSLPEVSPQLADQLRAINNPTSTLPIPIPVNLAHATSVQVQGVKGLAIGDNTGLGSGVVWEKDGTIYGVAGPLTENQVLSIANSLR